MIAPPGAVGVDCDAEGISRTATPLSPSVGLTDGLGRGGDRRVSMSGWMAMRSMTRDSSVKDRKLKPGTTRRVVHYARPYTRHIAAFLVLVVIASSLVVATPLL